ncbi:MAG: DMT family transporter [Cellvibrionales bacterium]|jgi:drug/metabolite transporter (DMT)-like permease|nr:DMT family transporter [Cellvibrionales bacterium]TXH52685.1 MAG: DMT family transporter [Cellvibrionales bacterium]HRF88110.1 DMT family transporter [Pseudomonadales bacterium]HRG50727.1 DMT family transporter [Pseudomonadales bacterium]
MSSASMRKGYLYGFITVCMWAGFVLLSRMAQASGLNSFDMTALRFGTASLLLFPAWLFWQRVPLFTLQTLLLALIGGIGYALCAYSAFHFAPASHGAVLLSGVLPFFVTLVAWLLLGEKPSAQRWLALSVIGGGVLCLAFYSLGDLQNSWPGDLLLLASSCLWAIYSVLAKRWGKTPKEITIGVGLLSALIYLPCYWLLLPKGIHDAAWSAILLQAFFQGVLVVVVAMLTFMKAMEQLGPTRLGAVMATVPAFAGIGAVVFLGEPFSWLLVLGLLLTCGGAWLGSKG